MRLLILTMLALTACGQSTRDKTIHATYVAVEAARAGFTSYDEAHQHELVVTATSLESGKAALAEWKATRAHIVEVFELTYQALSTALMLSDDQSLSALVKAAETLQLELGKLGILPKVLGTARQRPPSSPYATQYAWGGQ